MPEIISFILSLSIEQLKVFNYIRQSIKACIAHEYNDPELFHVWVAMVSLAGTVNISVDTILNLDPLPHLFEKIDIFFKKIDQVGGNLPADDLLAILIEILPSLDKDKTNELCQRLQFLSDFREAQYGPDLIVYAITSLNIALHAKQISMDTADEDEKLKDQRILNIIKAILHSDEKDESPLIHRDEKANEIVDVVVQLFQQMCSTVKYISCYQSIYQAYVDVLNIFIKNEISKEPVVVESYFKDDKQQNNYLSQILKDLSNPKAEIYKFKEKVSLFAALQNYHYITVMLGNQRAPKQETRLIVAPHVSNGSYFSKKIKPWFQMFKQINIIRKPGSKADVVPKKLIA